MQTSQALNRLSPSRTLPPAFTLVELLVVMAVMGVLAGLLMGVMSSARKSANTTHCVNNLQQIGKASLLYFGDHDGYLIPDKSYWLRNTSSQTPSGMLDYLGYSTDAPTGVDTILTCPTLKVLYPQMFPATPMNCTYSPNVYAFVLQPNSPNTELTVNGPIKLGAVPTASLMWMFTDGATSDTSKAGFAAQADMSYVPKYLLFPHDGCQNTVFMDGHVEAITQPDFVNRTTNMPREFFGDLGASN